MEDSKHIDISISTYEYSMGDGFMPRSDEEIQLAILTRKVEAMAEAMGIEFSVTLTRPSRF